MWFRVVLGVPSAGAALPTELRGWLKCTVPLSCSYQPRQFAICPFLEGANYSAKTAMWANACDFNYLLGFSNYFIQFVCLFEHKLEAAAAAAQMCPAHKSWCLCPQELSGPRLQPAQQGHSIPPWIWKPHHGLQQIPAALLWWYVGSTWESVWNQCVKLRGEE